MGLTAQSIAYSGRLDPKYNFLLMPLESYSSLKQAAVILKSSQHKTEAVQFMEYLLSSEGAQVLKKFGYLVPES
jgi:ABC-type molybdate transport system substrate-binding protein